ncbi:MAG: glycosyltransferase family 1 protein [Patescibacteria group bacterium]|jgi:glycosyltransferase involved in cell wall biosynthesis
MITIGIDASRANVRQRTGTEWYCYYLLKNFARIYDPTQHHIVLYLKEPLVADLKDLPADWEIRILRWPPKLLWTQLRLSLTMLVPWLRPDVLFIPAHTIPLIHVRNTVYVAHDLGFERNAALYANTYIGGKILHWLIKILTLGKYGTTELDYHRYSMRFAVRHAKKIITISEFTKHELQNCYTVSDHKIAVVHNGYDRTSYYETPNKVTMTQSYLFFVGRIELKKNINNLILAFAELKHTRHIPEQLWLAGQPGFGYEQITQLVKDQKLERDVKFLGYTEASALPDLMRQASAFIFPSHYEGFGIPVLEALAVGTKVACSDIGALREVGGEACWFFNQTDPHHMAQTILTCLQADQSVARQKSLTQVKQFSWERCAEQTWQVLLSQVD